jgi:2-polyprenyl-3-methyl-5-hydroxy-6-metoxy-1,4-benzoquinol methylase
MSNSVAKMDKSEKMLSREFEKEYRFVQVCACNMCGESTEEGAVIGLRLNRSQGLRPTSKEGIAVTVRRCSRCNLIYSSPLPVPFNVQNHYGVPPDEYWAESYFLNDPNYFSDEIRKAKNLIDFHQGMRALDVGAGLGKCMIALSQAGFDVEGFEPSIPFREKAIEKMGISEDKLKLGMIEEIDFPNESFDFITFGAVLEHLYDPSEAISKAIKWIKKDGVIQVEVPSSDWFISRLVNFYYKLIGTNYVTNISPMHEPYHLYEFNLKSFIDNGKVNNYEVISHDYSVCELVHVPRFLQPIFHWYMRKTNTGMQLTVWLKRTQ